MSRRTLPRAVVAGLLVAALGGPVAGKAPNPWRGESTTLPTAPAPRPVMKPTRQLIIGIGINSTSGLTGSVEVRGLSRAEPVESAPMPLRVEHRSRPVALPPLPETTPALPTITSSGVVPAGYVRVPEYMPPPKPLPVRAIPPAAP
ncbi:hypothetical protein [Urbifossiella limnaea]|uniref:Uncharacterized protein n=1 Tax=Urbifossiella limnaea TaxID=2528023 RepID=A0A517XX33_9BACT|nr:hypothetical protein [Urbifossiella limnaea]QDU22063.1 hypothetical protein ETAA1_40380 [Urbifossiella limnaea]